MYLWSMGSRVHLFSLHILPQEILLTYLPHWKLLEPRFSLKITFVTRRKIPNGCYIYAYAIFEEGKHLNGILSRYRVFLHVPVALTDSKEMFDRTFVAEWRRIEVMWKGSRGQSQLHYCSKLFRFA